MEFKLPFRLEDSNSVKVQHIINRIKNLEASGVNVINFALDETDLGTPKLIRAAAGDALLEQQNDYQPFDPEHILKKEICDYIDRTRGFRPKLEQILVGPGIKPILFCILFSILKSPNEIISTDPGSYIYNDLARITGSKIKYIKLDAENNYKISLIKLTKLLGKKTKAILLNSPQNPIGNVITNTEAQDLSEVAKDTDTIVISDETYSQIVISDETYSQIVYDGTHVSPATFDRATSQTIMLEELSCTFSMQGWGLGFCVGPIDFIEKLHMVTAETLQPVPDFIQY
jgi:aspartate/methionine/tyrosine aminotransferase